MNELSNSNELWIEIWALNELWIGMILGGFASELTIIFVPSFSSFSFDDSGFEPLQHDIPTLAGQMGNESSFSLQLVLNNLIFFSLFFFLTFSFLFLFLFLFFLSQPNTMKPPGTSATFSSPWWTFCEQSEKPPVQGILHFFAPKALSTSTHLLISFLLQRSALHWEWCDACAAVYAEVYASTDPQWSVCVS